MKSPIRIMIVDDEPTMIEWLSVLLRQKGYEVSMFTAGAKALQSAASRVPDVAVVDLRMPVMDGLELLTELRKLNPELIGIVMTAYSSIDTAVRAMREGATDYLVKPFDVEQLQLALERALRERQVLSENRMLRRQVRTSFDFSEIVGKSDVMLELLEQIRTVADKESVILIAGESGTGKELVARAIHYNSPRAEGPFLAVNCGSFTQTLLESELFGHAKGSFTGAHKDKTGLLVAASGGSFFLDEVSELDRELQVKLLRALQERQVLPVGSTKAVPFDVRLMAATNADLKGKVERGEFRADLYYRLNVIPLRVPPLRERLGDIPLLVERFTRLYASRLGAPVKVMSREAMEVLRSYLWPGNVRELENLMERLTVMTRSQVIGVEDLPDFIRVTADSQTASSGAEGVRTLSRPQTLAEIEKAWVFYVLEHVAGGQKRLAAKLLGIDESTLHRKLERYSRGQTAPEDGSSSS
jgi:DNA-binding NtrC family response regulator